MPSFGDFALAGLVAAAGVLAQNSTIQCAPGLQIFVSRGTSEPMGFGETGKLVEPILKAIDGSASEYIAYPASNGNATNGLPNYYQSVGNGTALLRRKITDYAQACPDSKMAVLGYSQGAQVTSNNFCGSPPFWAIESGVTDIAELLEFSTPLSAQITKNVVAVVLFGDTTHQHGASYNHGNSTGSGIFWRSDISACEGLGDRMRAYCDQGDPFCDVGAVPNPTAHLLYVPIHGEEVIKYVVNQYQNGGNSDGSESPTSPLPTPGNEPPLSAASGLSVSFVAAVIPLLALGFM